MPDKRVAGMGNVMNRHYPVLNLVFLTMVLLLSGCDRQQSEPTTENSSSSASGSISLAEARHGFTTQLISHEAQREPVPVPPPKLFSVVHYDSSAGKLAAYLSQPTHDGKKHAAIIWITGGFGNDIGDIAWTPGPASNDQSASAFWKAGVVTMYPSFRGGNDNPGYQEGFYGEVDDVLAAADYLAKQDFVDPQRIYLGGHSTGGTLALLAAEMSGHRFRAAFCFGPVEDVTGYGAEQLPFDITNRKERELRAPVRWLNSIQSPVFVFEGTEHPSNIESLKFMASQSSPPTVHFYPVKGVTHFSILAPMTHLLANKILSDDGPATNITFSEQELSDLVIK